MEIKRLPFQFKRNSLFIKLLSGFLGLILLLLSFNFLSFTFFSDNIQKEIIRNNKLNLANTVDRYENHMRFIQSTIIELYFNEKVLLLNELGDSRQFEAVNQVADEIKKITGNELLYLDNIIIQFRLNDFAIDKHGANETDWLFTRNFVSGDYGVPFWREQLRQSYKMNIFPSSIFSDTINIKKSELIPLIIKNKITDHFYIAAFMNASKMFEAFSNSNQSQFYLLNDEGQFIYRSSDERPEFDFTAAATNPDDYMKHDKSYYFYKKGAVTGLTYLSVIPNNKIASETSRLNLVLITIFLLAVTISVLISIVLSVKFNSPIQKIMHAIQKQQSGSPLQSKIDEYNFIYDNIKQFMKTNQDFHVDLKRNSAQLRHLGYMRKVKNIYSGNNELADEIRPFYLIGFHLTMTEHFGRLLAAEQDRAMYYIMEFINTSLSDSFTDPVTLQVEKDQILAIAFSEQASADLLPALHRLKLVFDLDKEYCYLTIAVNPVLRNPSEFTAAYEETLEMINRRKLAGETQIIAEMPAEPLVYGFSTGQEQEFLSHMQAGQEAIVIAMVSRQLAHMEKISATAHQYADFTKETIAKTIKILITMGLDISAVFDMTSPYQKIKECICLQDYVALCEQFLSKSSQMIAEKKNGSDPIKHMLIEYVNNHYNEDISLEMVAEELNLSIHYISKYFKEKTGMNFLDYLSELRIVKAKELLLNSKLKIQDIAEQVGYVNTNSFIRMFRKATGISPGEFRKQRLAIEGP